MPVIDAWNIIGSFESNRIIEQLLEGDGNHIEYYMDPPSTFTPGQALLHISCNTLAIPHLAYLSQAILKEAGIDFTTFGGPENCCGGAHWARDDDESGRQIGELTLGAFSRVQPIQVISTCPDCDLAFEMYMRKQDKFRHINLAEFLFNNIELLKPLFVNKIDKRVVLHYHESNPGRVRDRESVESILSAIPGIELLHSESSVGIDNHCLLPATRRRGTLHEPTIKAMFEEAVQLEANALVVPYHGCYRWYLSRELEYPIGVTHYLELLAETMGIEYDNKFRKLRMMNDLNKALDSVRSRSMELGFEENAVRKAFETKVYV